MLKRSLEDARNLTFGIPCSEEDEHQAAVSRAEELVLDHFPETPDEVLLVLDVLLLNVQTGERTDGKDSGAIQNLKCWVMAHSAAFSGMPAQTVTAIR